MILLARLHALALACLLAFSPVAQASQNSLFSPNTGTVSGLQLTNNYNSAIDSLNACNSGSSSPVNQLSGVPSAGNCWLDTTTTPYKLKRHDGNGHYVIIGYLEPSTGAWYPINGGGAGTITSATATDIGTIPQTIISVTGTTTITSLGSSAPQPGIRKTLVFAGALVLTCNGTSLILPTPGCINITTQAGDVAFADYLGGGNWRVSAYTRNDGTALNASSNFQGAIFANSPITVTLGSNTNDWNPSGLATANVIRLTCSSPINVTGITAPATDGKILVIDNVGGTNTCTLTTQDTNSSAANRFGFDRPVAVRPGATRTIKYDLTAARWRLIDVDVAQPVVRGFANLKIVNGGTPNNQLTITADELVIEDVTNRAARLGSVNCTADITASGAGGLDTGSVAQNQGYYLWTIYNPTTNTTSCMFSLASAFGSITLPSGYTFAARVGWNFVENAAGKRLYRIVCYGRRCQPVVTASSATAALPVMASGTAGSVSTPTWVPISVSSFVPATASRIMLTISASLNTASAIVAPNNSYGPAGTTNAPPMILNAGGTSLLVAAQGEFALESSNIYWANNGASATLALMGWEDNF